MLAQRFGSAIVLIPVIFALAYLGGWWYSGFLVLGSLAAVYEFYAVIRHAGQRPSLSLMSIFSTAFLLSVYSSRSGIERLLVAAALIAVSGWQLARRADDRSLADWALTLAPSLYIGWLAGLLALVRSAPSGWHWTLFTFLIVFVTDTAAYFGGRAWGHTPFAPTISPKKTWEGAFVGWLYATLFAVGLARFFSLPLLPAHAAGLGLAASLVATAGDLTMSFVKRQGHVKDSGYLIPGHGGLLDRVDSLLPAAAVIYAYIWWITG